MSLDIGFGKSRSKTTGGPEPREKAIRYAEAARVAEPGFFLEQLPYLLGSSTERSPLWRFFEPSRIRTADLATLSGENLLRSFGRDVGRRGLSGSGFDLMGRQAIRGGTQALINEALVKFYQQMLQAAYEKATESQKMQFERVMRAPYRTLGTETSWGVGAKAGFDFG